MTNAELFKSTFGIYSAEMWSMTEDEYLEWSNSKAQGGYSVQIDIDAKSAEQIKRLLDKPGKIVFTTSILGAEKEK